MRTLVVGRSPYADVVLADVSVAPHHAEIVVTDDDRFYIVDCATAGGTWRQAGADAAWQQIRQAFVAPDEPLRLGEHLCTAEGLVRSARAAADEDKAGEGGTWDTHGGPRRRLRGRVARDAVTGEIVRRRR